MDTEQALDIFKALSNPTRLAILRWLKHPEDNFPPQGEHLDPVIDLHGGVCSSSIAEKAGMAPSTTSHYLDLMQRAGLLTSERHGRWTYYRRNERVVGSLPKDRDRLLKQLDRLTADAQAGKLDHFRETVIGL